MSAMVMRWKGIRWLKWAILSLLLLSLAIAFFQTHAAHAANVDPQRIDPTVPAVGYQIQSDDHTVIVGGDSAYPPYQYLENGEPKGFDIDVLRGVAEMMGLELEFRLGNWADARRDLLEGKVDVLAGMAFSEERNRFYDYSTPFATLNFDLFTRHGSTLDGLDDLDGKSIIVQDGGLMEDFLVNGNYGARIIRATDALAALKLLVSGQYDGALLNKAQAMFFIRQYRYRNVQAMGLQIEPTPYSFTVAKGNLPLLTKLNQGLLLLVNSGDYNKIYNRWFSLDDRDVYWQVAKTYLYIFGAIVFILLVVIAWSRILQLQVQKRTRELTASEEKYRKLVENSAEGVMVVHGGETLFANRSALAILGYSLEELNRFPVYDLVHPEDFERVSREYLAQVTEGATHPKRISHRIVRSDGQIRWLELSPVRIHWEEKQVVLAIFSDVSEHIRAMSALRESEDKFFTAFRTSPDSICITTLKEGRFLEVNEGFVALTGYSAEEVRNKTTLQLNLWTQREDQDWLVEQLKSHGQVLDMEAEVRSKNGTVRSGSVSSRLIEIHGEPCVLTIIRDITERKLSEERFRQQMQRLATLRVVDMTIAASMELDQVLNVLLEKFLTELKVDACVLFLLNSNLQLVYRASVGVEKEKVSGTVINLGEKHAGWAALHWKPVYVLQSEEEPDELLSRSDLVEDGFTAYYCSPLMAKGRVLGVLEIFNRKPMPADPEWISFFEALADQAAIAIDNASLMETVEQTNQELIAAYDATIQGWARALELRDGDTEGHSQRVLMMTLAIARKLGFQDADLVHIQRGALLHDIGKMAVPDNILLKAGPLTPEEWEIMRKHPQYAYELLSEISFLRPALDIPYCHHERWNGSGYPRGLVGEQIPLPARIFAVVDVWDALLSNRPYRSAWEEECTYEYFRKNSGILFDPAVIEAFFEQVNALDSPSKYRQAGSTHRAIG